MLPAPRGRRRANSGLEFARRHPGMGATLAVRLAEIEGTLWRRVRWPSRGGLTVAASK
jgi:hypothetical protein